MTKLQWNEEDKKIGRTLDSKISPSGRTYIVTEGRGKFFVEAYAEDGAEIELSAPIFDSASEAMAWAENEENLSIVVSLGDWNNEPEAVFTGSVAMAMAQAEADYLVENLAISMMNEFGCPVEVRASATWILTTCAYARI